MNRQEGFTLVELLVALTIGITTMSAAMGVLIGANKRSDEALRRADATQRARVTMDAITQDLRSQTCLRSGATPLPPMIAGTPTSVTFYMDYSETTSTTERRSITLDTSTATVTERKWTDPTAATGTPTQRVLGNSMAGGTDGALFTYYAFNKTTGAADRVLTPTSTGLTTADLASVARIVVTLRALPRGTVQNNTRVTPLLGEVFSRLVDPDGSPVALCA